MKIKFLEKFRTWQLALILTLICAFNNRLIFEPMVFFLVSLLMMPLAYWILRVNDNGLFRGSRLALKRADTLIDKEGVALVKKILELSLRLCHFLYRISGYGKLPYLLRAILLIVWWGIPAYFFFSVFRNSSIVEKSHEDLIHAINSVVDLTRYTNGINSTALVYGGGLILVGICHFIFRILERFLSWLKTKYLLLVLNIKL